MRLGIGTTITLNDGTEMPLLGFGTYKLAEGREVEEAVAAALQAGYRGIDTASMYGNERGIGRAIRESGLARESVFLATKCWNDEQGYPQALDALHRSLERLDTDYVDLYMIHWPVPGLLAGTWQAFQEAQAAGLVRSIGVSNFLVPHLEELSRMAEIPPSVDQVEFHPGLQQPDLVAYCREQRIQVQAWAPLMRGRVFEIPEVVDIARAHARTPAQVTIRWMLQRSIATIPKSAHADRIRENADVFDFELTREECDRIDALDAGERIGRHPDSWGIG